MTTAWDKMLVLFETPAGYAVFKVKISYLAGFGHTHPVEGSRETHASGEAGTDGKIS